MKKLVKALLCSASFSLCSTQAEEQQSDWIYSVNVNWRSFGDFDFDAFDMSPGDESYLDGSVQVVGVDGSGNPILWRYTVANSLDQIDVISLNEVTYSQGNFTGASDDINSGLGIVLKAKNKYSITETASIFSVLSIATANTDDSHSASGSISYVGYDLGAGNFWNGAPGGGPDPSTLEMDFAEHTIMPIAPAGSTSAMVSFDVDMTVYTFAYGLEAAAYQNNGTTLNLSCGPTLTVVNYDLERSFVARNSSGTVLASMREKDDDFSLRAGGYVSAGFSHSFSEDWEFNGGLRYDWIPVDLETDFGDMELSGTSAFFGVTLEF